MNYHIAETVKEIRRVHNLTQDNLAELIGMSSGHIGMLEQGRAKPSYDTLEKLITEFNLDANMFFASRKDHHQLIASELCELLNGLPEGQPHRLAQLFRAGAQIVALGENNENCNL